MGFIIVSYILHVMCLYHGPKALYDSCLFADCTLEVYRPLDFEVSVFAWNFVGKFVKLFHISYLFLAYYYYFKRLTCIDNSWVVMKEGW